MPEFTGLEKEFTEAVAERLIRFSPGNTVPDWSRILLVLPGKETIRNLSETLAARYGSLFPPVMITGSGFALFGRDLSQTASRAEEYCAWMKTVHAAPAEEYPGLLPGEQEDPARKLALRSAFAFGDLRRELEEGGKTLADAARITGEERFEKLARLEEQFLAVLKEQGKQTLLMEEQLNGTEERALDGFETVVFAGVPDLSPSGTRRAERLLQMNRAQVWIYAPEEWREFFDGTGHPLPPASAWVKNCIRIRDFRKRVLKAEGPSEGARIAAALVTASGELSPDRTRIISADPAFFPFIRDEMEKLGPGKTPPEIYDPAGESLSGLRIAAFLRALEAFLNDGDFESAANLLRNGDFLRSLTKQENEFLTELDRFRQEHLPDDPENVRIFLLAQPEPSFLLLPAFQRLKEIRDAFPEDGSGFVPALRDLLNRVFPSAGLFPVRGIPFESEAAGMAEILDEMEGGCIFSPDSGFALLRKLLEGSRVYGDHAGFSYPVHGFYESPFFPPADTVLAGVNAGYLPEQKQNTPFLTESLRKRLGLEGNAVQEVRDACRLAILLEVCHAAGKTVDLIAFRNDASGAPCRFSPFLFGSEADFLARTTQLYADLPPLQEPGRKKGGTLSFSLRPVFAGKEGLTLSVTDFKSFLTSPFLFFLQRRQHWEERDYRGRDLDHAAFGNACHDAVQAAQSFPASGEESVLTARMKDRLAEYMKRQYGEPLPALPALQKRQMEQRLRFASPHLLESLREYRVIGIEYPLGGETEKSLLFRKEKNWRIKGRIDRIEYSDARKELRLIDFKTSTRTPEQAHVIRDRRTGGFRFTDLQLPLYAILIRRDPVFRQDHPEIDWDDLTVRCGYFLMPPTAEGTGYSIWEQMDEPLLKMAEERAEEIFAEAEAMQEGYFPAKWDKTNPYHDPMMTVLQMPDLKTVFPGITEREAPHA